MAENTKQHKRVLAFLRKAKGFWTKKAREVSTRPRSASAPVKELSTAASSQHRVGTLVLLPPVAFGDAFDGAAWSTINFDQEVRGRPRYRAGKSTGLYQQRWSMPILQQSSHLAAPGPAATPVHLPVEQPTLTSEEPDVTTAEEQDFQAQAEEIQLLVHRPVEVLDAVLGSLKADQERHRAAARKTHLALTQNHVPKSNTAQAQPSAPQTEALTASPASPASQNTESTKEATADHATPSLEPPSSSSPELPSSSSSVYSSSINGGRTGAESPSGSASPFTSHGQGSSSPPDGDEASPKHGMCIGMPCTEVEAPAAPPLTDLRHGQTSPATNDHTSPAKVKPSQIPKWKGTTLSSSPLAPNKNHGQSTSSSTVNGTPALKPGQTVLHGMVGPNKVASSPPTLNMSQGHVFPSTSQKTSPAKAGPNNVSTVFKDTKSKSQSSPPTPSTSHGQVSSSTSKKTSPAKAGPSKVSTVTKSKSPSPPPIIPPRNPAKLYTTKPSQSSAANGAEIKDRVRDSGVSVTAADEAGSAGNDTGKDTTSKAARGACK